MTKNFVLNSTTLMVSLADLIKLSEFMEMGFFVDNRFEGEEEQDTLVYLPEGLAKGGKKIPLSASFYDHKDISAGEIIIMMMMMTTMTM